MGRDTGEHAGLAALAAQDLGRSAPLWGTLAAGGLPLLYYLATASGFGYWLDAGEFVAAARSLGIAHPPGQPLAALYNGLFARLPIGPLSFRVAAASAVAMAAALAFAFRATYHSLVLAGLLSVRARALLSLSVVWSTGAGVGVWLQAVRPEVYALQAALAAISLDGLVRYEREAPDGPPSPLYVAAFAEGLALSNHHFLAFLLLPAAAPTAARALVRHGARAMLPVLAFVLLGLSTYVYLPLRAHADPTPNLGAPTDLARFFWVVSAQAFQNTHALPTEGAGTRIADVAVALFETLGWPLLVAAFGGAYMSLRNAAWRRLGVVWAAVFTLSVLARAWLGFVRHNPDALGYLVPAYFALAALAALFVAVVLQTALARPRVATALCGLLACTGLWRLNTAADTQDLSRFDATEAFDRIGLRVLPYGAVVFLHDPQSVFNAFGQQLERAERPDLTMVPVPLLTYPGMVDHLLTRAPELRAVLRDYLISGELRQPELQTLATQRPLFIELDPRVPPALYETLVPWSLSLHRVLADGATERDEQEGAARARRHETLLYATLGPEALHEARTRERLLWMHYATALYYMGVGDHESADHALERGLVLAPDSQELLAMRAALRQSERNPIDVRPFLMREP